MIEEAPPPWRGLVNQMTYGWEIGDLVDDEAIGRIVREMLLQRMFRSPAEHYYLAAVQALESGLPIPSYDGQSEPGLRNLLVRIVAELDRQRPWTEPPFCITSLHPSDISEFVEPPIVGVVPISSNAVSDVVHASFYDVPFDRKMVLTLRLQTGAEVALCARPPYATTPVEVRSHDDPASTLAALAELTGLPVVPNPPEQR